MKLPYLAMFMWRFELIFGEIFEAAVPLAQFAVAKRVLEQSFQEPHVAVPFVDAIREHRPPGTSLGVQACIQPTLARRIRQRRGPQLGPPRNQQEDGGESRSTVTAKSWTEIPEK